MATAPPAPPERRELLVLFLLVLVGAALRFYRISAQSLWMDEFLMIQRASLGDPFRWNDWFVNPQGPLPALVLRLWTAVAGSSEAALRFPSAVFGILTIPAVYALARQIAPEAGLPAALLATVSPFLIWYSQETRHYALAFLAAAWSTWAVLRLNGDYPQRLVRRLVQCSASLLVGMMSNLTMIFLAAGQFLALAVRSRRLLGYWLAAIIPVFVVMVPWFRVTFMHNLNLDHAISSGPIAPEEMLRGESTFTWLGLPYTLFVFFGGYSLGPPLAALHEAPRLATVLPYLPVILLLAAGCATLIVVGLWQLRNRRFPRDLTIFTVLVALVLVVLLSWRNIKVFNPRYLGIALPLLLGVAGLGSARLRRTSLPLWIGVWLLVLAPSLLSLRNYYRGGVYAREDIRSAAALLDRAASAEDVVLYEGGGAAVALWYYRGPAPAHVVYQVWVRQPARLEALVSEWTAGKRSVWLLMSRMWDEDPGLLLKSMLETRYGPGETHLFRGATLVRYGIR